MIPSSTYRLQVSRDQDLDRVRELVPYLHRLGISALYLSPLFHARSGSAHGYDAIDPTRISEELGGRSALLRLVEVLGEHEMGLLLDIVPNHLAATPENPWWREVLEHGPAAHHASYFDIDWRRPEPPADGRVILPILGERYGEALAGGKFTIGVSREGFGVTYHETTLPLDPRSYPAIIDSDGPFAPDERSAESLPRPTFGGEPGFGGGGGGTAVHTVLAGLMEEFGALPDRSESNPEARQRRLSETPRLQKALWRVYSDDAEARRAVDDALARMNGAGRPGEEGEGRLDEVLARQAYWLVFWRTEADTINYRRFFNISDLVGVRVEEPEVFRATHDVIAELVRSGAVTGLRVDHVDGLHDPDEYLERLWELQQERDPPAQRPLHIVVEKILAEDERLPDGWPVSGSTGYDFLAVLNGLFVDPAGLAAIERDYREWLDFHDPFTELLYRKKRAIAGDLFSGEFTVLARWAARLVRSLPQGRDFTTGEVRAALVEATASLSVYRTYIREGPVRDEDRRRIEGALADARRRAPHLPPLLLELLGAILMESGEAAGRAEAQIFTRRWQQITGAIMAKGMEDTTFYIYNALVSLNEVGGEPGSGATSIAHFHDFNRERLGRWPGGLNTTSTHDTKRSEDVRSRISVLSELPSPWKAKVRQWREWNRSRRITVGEREVPSGNEEIMLYQNLLGAWPLREEEVEEFRRRMEGYLTKALREAKVHSSWRSPDEGYERALADFTESILDPAAGGPFPGDFRQFQEEVAFYGALNSLSQLVLKIISPGVPDFYQGTELWTFSLVDPDNRRPVDFRQRTRLLEELDSGEPLFPHRLLDSWMDGRIKLMLTRTALRFRRERRDLFLHGAYLPLRASGVHRENIVAAAREAEGEWVVGLAPRLYTRLASLGALPLGPEVWKDTSLALPRGAPREWVDILTGTRIVARESGRGEGAGESGDEGGDATRLQVGEVLTKLPVAILRSL